MSKTFMGIQALYEDMRDNNQSFIKSENEYSDGKSIIEGETIYRSVEFDKGKLQFHSNKFGGSNFRISGDVLYTEKVGEPDDEFCEYRLIIKGRGSPLILLACKK